MDTACCRRCGGSLGAALLIWYQKLDNLKKVENSDGMQNSLLGRSFTQSEIEHELHSLKSILIPMMRIN